MFDGASEGYVKYTITPELGTPISTGEIVTITGTSYYRDFATKYVCVTLVLGSGSVQFKVARSLAKGKAGSFTLQFEMPEITERWFAGRTGEIIFYFTLMQNESQGSSTTRDNAQKLTVLKYRLNAQVLAMDFERCNASGIWADDGQFFRCKMLQLAINPQMPIGEITTAKIVCTGTDGSTQTMNLTSSQLATALSSGGYTEPGYDSANVFYGFTSMLGVTYTLTLTIADQYEQVFFTDTIMRSFARLHLSGAKNGGVAIGMFSSASDEQPKFEVADTHESLFYGGVASFGGDALCEKSQHALGIQYGTFGPLGSTASGKYKDYTVEFQTPFSEGTTPLVFITFVSTSTAGNFGRCCVAAHSISNIGFTSRFFNGDSAGRNPYFNWLAIGQIPD